MHYMQCAFQSGVLMAIVEVSSAGAEGPRLTVPLSSLGSRFILLPSPLLSWSRAAHLSHTLGRLS